jgi:16S rRNA (uracil1498-N3)-methyltransferase
LGGEYAAQVCHMGRAEVRVQVLSHSAIEREACRAVHLALGVPANERMDYLVEKATELGVARITPLMTERGVLRLAGERADKKRQHWQQVAIAASEQCGRNRVPQIDAAIDVKTWLGQQAVLQTGAAPVQRYVLSLSPDALQALTAAQSLAHKPSDVLFLSGAEGGLSPIEESAAIAAGFAPLSLGPRTLRAETAPLQALVLFT